MLNALISNQVRHHENWGIIVKLKHKSLAPTFDHASSLGRNELDKNRLEMLQTNDIGRSINRYVERAKSGFFHSSPSGKVLSTIDAFKDMAKLDLNATKYWLDKLKLTQTDDLVTEPAIDFALRILEINKLRLFEIRETL